LISDFQHKSNQASYAERRANVMLENDDYEMETELQLAMEEITQAEKDFK
jgi:hypothetical protein